MNNEHLNFLGHFRCYQPFYFIKFYQAWMYGVYIWEVFELFFSVLVFYCLRRLRLCLNHLVIFSCFLSFTMLPKIPPSYKFQYFFCNGNLNINSHQMCLNHYPIFLEPSNFISPTHVASSSSYVTLWETVSTKTKLACN